MPPLSAGRPPTSTPVSPNEDGTVAAGGQLGAAVRPGTGLCANALAQYLDARFVLQELVALTGSTNTDLLQRARQAALTAPVLRVAQRQSAGRGRRGRLWLGSAGSVLLSVGLPWEPAPPDSAGVTLCCGLAVAESVAAQLPDGTARAGAQVLVKWPNDVLLDGAKLAGLLTELAEDAHGRRSLIVGLGLNLWVDAVQRRGLADDGSGASLQPGELARYLDRDTLRSQREVWIARLALCLLDAAQGFARDGFAGRRRAFEARCAYRTAWVEVIDAAGATVRGVVQGVDDRGQLVLAVQGHRRVFNSGSLRLAAPPAGAAA